MRFVFRREVPLPPALAFERLRHFERLYPDLHPAHEDLPPGHVPAPIAPGGRFALAERLGPEHRRYAFAVAAFEPEARRIRLEAEVETRRGRLRLGSRLALELRVEAPGGAGAPGCAVEIVQVVSFGRPWLDRLLAHPALWRAVAAHAEEECAAATRLIQESDRFP